MAKRATSLANLAVNSSGADTESSKTDHKRSSRSASAQASKRPAEEGAPDNPGQISFRVNRDAYRDLKRMAVDEDLTIKELIIRAVNDLRQKKGLKKLDL